MNLPLHVPGLEIVVPVADPSHVSADTFECVLYDLAFIGFCFCRNPLKPRLKLKPLLYAEFQLDGLMLQLKMLRLRTAKEDIMDDETIKCHVTLLS